MSDGLATDDDFIIKEKSTAFWDMVAQDYCSRVLQGWDGKDWICEVCKSMFPEDQPLRILDVGAGSGYVSAYLSKMGHDVTATDTSKEMLNQIIKLAAMENLNLQIIKDDIMNTNLHRASYDAIVMIDVLFCLPDVRKALHNCIDLLHPGGLLVILDGNYLLHLYSDEYSSRDAFYQMKNGRKESAEMLHLTEEEFLELSKIFGNSRINSTKRPKQEVDLLMDHGMNNIRIVYDMHDGFTYLSENGNVPAPIRFSIISRKPIYSDQPVLDTRGEQLLIFPYHSFPSNVVGNVFSALGNEDRIRILNLLMISPKRVKDLADTMGLSENKTSYHLNILKDAGFIYSSKSGRDTIYSLKDAFAFKNLLSAVMGLCRID